LRLPADFPTKAISPERFGDLPACRRGNSRSKLPDKRLPGEQARPTKAFDSDSLNFWRCTRQNPRVPAAVRVVVPGTDPNPFLETKAATILQFIHGLRGSLHVTFEEGTCAAWLHDLLKPHVTQVLGL